MFGSAMLPMGGYAGGCDGLGGACEYQREGDPHIHMNVYLVSAYQHGTLQKVAEAIRTHIFDVEALKNFHMHICSEEYPDVEKRDEEKESLEKDWPQFAGPDHVALGVLRAYITSTTGERMLWEKPSSS